MSGTIGDNVYRASGVIASAAGGGISWQDVVTGSTLTAVAGNGYPIDTTSNTCTITLPASASVGDEIIFTDYAGKWGTNKIILDSNGLNYEEYDDSWNVYYTTSATVLHIFYADATKGWMPILDKTVDLNKPTGTPHNTAEGIFAYGTLEIGATAVATSNKISDAGVCASDVGGVGTARQNPAACEYGGDKGIFAFGSIPAGGTMYNISNLVSNTGVIQSDGAGVGSLSGYRPGATYGGDKGIVAFGTVSGVGPSAISNLISNVGVVQSDTAAVAGATARTNVGAVEYGGSKDKAIFAFGTSQNVSNKVSNTGVVASDTAGVGSARSCRQACGYGEGSGIFAYGGGDGSAVSTINKVSSAGVIATDTTGTGTARYFSGACEYGDDKGVFGFGAEAYAVGNYLGVTNLVTNVGVIGSDVGAVGTAKAMVGACSFA